MTTAAEDTTQARAIVAGGLREARRRLEAARLDAERWGATGGKGTPFRYLPYRLSMPRWAFALVVSSALAFTAGGVSLLTSRDPAMVLTAFGATYVVSGLLLAAVFRPHDWEQWPSDEARERYATYLERRAQSRSRLHDAQALHDRLAIQLRELDEAVRREEEEAQRRALAQYKLDVLWQTDIDELDGEQFEHYLAYLFVALGFHVEHTGVGGADQGVDLIVSRDMLRVAVQAKCYSSSVGNAAVQQAVTGMALYGCNASAVVTNARFTRAAQQLAAANGCRLIDGEEIRILLREAIEFHLADAADHASPAMGLFAG